jgi:hypothetical protein
LQCRHTTNTHTESGAEVAQLQQNANMKTIGWLILKYCRECAHCLNKTDTVQYENLPCILILLFSAQ